MDPIIGGALIAGGASLIGGAISSHGQSNANKMNLKIAREQMQWNESMWHKQNEYNTPAAQIDRMRQAGLNPALMYSQGNVGNAGEVKGYSVPVMQNESEAIGQSVQAAGSTALNAFVTSQKMQQLKAETDLLKARAAKEIATTPDEQDWREWFNLRKTGQQTQNALTYARELSQRTFNQYADNLYYNQSRLAYQRANKEAIEASYYDDFMQAKVDLTKNQRDVAFEVFRKTLLNNQLFEKLMPYQVLRLEKEIIYLMSRNKLNYWQMKSGLNLGSIIKILMGSR